MVTSRIILVYNKGGLYVKCETEEVMNKKIIILIISIIIAIIAAVIIYSEVRFQSKYEIIYKGDFDFLRGGEGIGDLKNPEYYNYLFKKLPKGPVRSVKKAAKIGEKALILAFSKELMKNAEVLEVYSSTNNLAWMVRTNLKSPTTGRNPNVIIRKSDGKILAFSLL